MSGQFQLQCDAVLSVNLVYIHPAHGSASHYSQDFSPYNTIRQLKEDMAAKLAVSVDEQIWKYKGKVLQDHQTLDDLEVDPDDTLEVTSKLAGNS